MKIIVAITGASGSIYAQQLLNKLEKYRSQINEVSVVFSDNAKLIWESEIGEKHIKSENINEYENTDFYAPFASGSAKYDAMIVCPCSMGTLGRIANGISNDLITRAADVCLKERRKLIVLTRETPFSLIHINNMKSITEAGAIICDANPSFYSNPKNIEELVNTVIDRVLDLTGLSINSKRWSE